MYIKIYFGSKPVYLCDEIDKELNEILHHPDAVFVDESSGPAIKSLLHEIRKEEFHAGVLWNTDLGKLKKAFFKHFSLIEAAGGIVENDKKELLFIYRLGKWDLPKGKVEEGENLETCAIREVEEETGVKKLTLKAKVGETYHTYDAYGKHMLKTTHWYHMTCRKDQKLVPQAEEDITGIQWIKKKDIDQPLSDTYASVRDILLLFLEKTRAAKTV
jgi:ADP-ribose pyrophosphatase YjhB (NUDIX family)